MRGPFEYESVGGEFGRIAVPFKRPDMNRFLASYQTHSLCGSKVNKITFRLEPSLLLKLAFGSIENILPFFHQTLRYGPDSLILLCKKRPTRVSQENFK